MTDDIKYLPVNGAELGYSVRGEGGGKLPLVFVHGGFLRATAGPYEDLLDRLADRYTVYALDLRGHGASAEALEGWSHAAVADDVVAFSNALGLDRPAFVGHSMGGFVGLFAEVRHPGSFSGVCLLSPGPADHTQDPVEALNFLAEHGHDREMMRGGFVRMHARPPGPTLELMLDAITLIDKRLFSAVRASNARTSIEDQLKDVQTPVLLVLGEQDSVIPPAKQHDLAHKLPRCKEVTFSYEGHMLPNESPATAAREVIGFLDHDLAA